MNDCGGIEAARTTQKNGALQETDIFVGVEAIFALRALWNDEAERLPGAKRRRRNADTASDFADAKERLRSERFRYVG